MSQRHQLLSISFLCLAAIAPPGRLAQPSAPPATKSATQEPVETEIEFRSGELTLAGTLLLPHSAGPHPAVLFMLVRGEGSRFWRRHSVVVVGVALLFVAFLGYWHLLGL